eukprot:9959588-Alexandrium_andersonii.AAC.1
MGGRGGRGASLGVKGNGDCEKGGWGLPVRAGLGWQSGHAAGGQSRTWPRRVAKGWTRSACEFHNWQS